MKSVAAVFVSAAVVTAMLGTVGCASYRTIATAEHGTPKVFSGTRLDVQAILHNEYGLRKFKTEPPSYPWLDLPFSIFVDMMVVPLSFSAALYETMFE
jgi:uncharacterized protein YceK